MTNTQLFITAVLIFIPCVYLGYEIDQLRKRIRFLEQLWVEEQRRANARS
jgi:hypothetical protein